MRMERADGLVHHVTQAYRLALDWLRDVYRKSRPRTAD